MIGTFFASDFEEAISCTARHDSLLAVGGQGEVPRRSRLPDGTFGLLEFTLQRVFVHAEA